MINSHIDMKLIFLIIVLFNTVNGCSQINKESELWSQKEKEYYRTLIDLKSYLEANKYSKISKDSIFDKYVFFENVLNDTAGDRRERRINMFDSIFKYIPETLDSIGADNINFKPIRFYKSQKIYHPFQKTLQGLESEVFVYFVNEKEPIGCILFDKETSKIVSWILLRQGDSGWFFLTFDLL